MKRIINIIIVNLLFVSMISCNRKVEFEHETFATLETNSYSVDETVGLISIPVTIFNHPGTTIQITVTPTDGKAEDGDDYQIVSPANGILSFSPDDTTKDIEIEITSHEGEFTGAKDFKIQIASVTDGVSIGAYNSTKITIKDLDHPLANFIGEWTGSVNDYWGDSYTMDINIEGNESDDTYTTLLVNDLDPYFASNGVNSASGANIFVATADKDKTVLTIKMGDKIGYNDLYIVGFNAPDPGSATANDNIYIRLNDNGTLSIPYCFGIYQEGDTPENSGYWSLNLGGIILKRK